MPTVIDLSTLALPDGFIVQGDAADDRMGASVANAGDVNGDGYDDFIVGARLADNFVGTNVGEAYLIFGKGTPFANIDVTTLAPADGIVIEGAFGGDWLGKSVASAGDINGDGFDDVILGAPYGDVGGTSAGEAYVIFGKSGGWANISLGTLAPADGFVIQGGASFERAGSGVASAGDINGDGYDDILVGAPLRDAGGNARGTAYLLFGKSSGFANVDLGALSPADGFTITGAADLDTIGEGLASAGDLNGDGYDDFLVGVRNNDDGGSGAGKTWVIFGKASGFTDIDLDALAPTDGFAIQGAAASDDLGRSVSSAGDFNGDGYADLITGISGSDIGYAGSGGAFILFGKASGFTDIDLANVSATDGVFIFGEGAGDSMGRSVSAAGDVNGDGFDDVIVGAIASDTGGALSGSAYIVFGRAGPVANVQLGSLGDDEGVIIIGDAAGDQAGFGVSAAGDINGDGYDDVVVGAPYGDNGGIDAGEAYVIFGSGTGAQTDFPLIFDLGTDLNALSGSIIIGVDPTDNAGHSVSSAGDINGDGYDDIIVGAPYAGSVAAPQEGEAYVIFGRAGGFVSIDLAALALADGFRIRGDLAGDRAGKSVASAGDFNGDGFDDLIVGANYGDNGGAEAGEAYVIFGKSAGFTNINLGVVPPATAGFIIQGADPGDGAGWSVSSAGDINGDGLDDVLVGARLGDNGGTDAGEVYVIFGKSAGIATIDLAALAPADGFIIQGEDAGDRLGTSVSSAGDINGDGFDDIIVGAPQRDLGGYSHGEAYVIFGKAAGFTNIDLDTLAPADGFSIQGDADSDFAGWSVATAGDINGDGLDDIVLGAFGGDNGGADAGEAYVIFGKSAGFANIDLAALAPADGFIIQGDAADDEAGWSVASAGDVNGDGFDDLIVGAPSGDNGANMAGEAYVIFGKPGAFANIDLAVLAPADGFIIQADTDFARAGFDVSAAGDVDGDGFDDILVGVIQDDAGGDNAGAAYVIYGRGAGSPVFPSMFDPGEDINPASGATILGADAGDRAGFSVASAGDINGDGYDDVILGAPYGDNGGASAGEAYVLFGSADGIAGLDLTALALADGFVIQGDAAGDQAGFSVSSAGDINGDGFDDLIVGAPYGDNGGNYAGEAYVILGKASGFANIDLTTPIAPAAGFLIRGDAAYDFNGRAVSSAGDINGDGFDDIIIGAPLGDNGGTNAGEAYVIFGKNGGFAGIDLTTLAPADGFIIQGDVDQDNAGWSVSSAGDINNDGFDDLIVGARFGDNGGTNAGEAYVIFGKSAAFTNIDLTTLTPAQGFIIQGDADDDYAGYSVSSAGDVNGDGYDDLVIGAPYGDNGGASGGAAYVIFGKLSGFADIDLGALAPADGFTISGGDSGDLAGFSATGAGDVNGDGFDDLIVGTPYNGDFGNLAGAAYVVFGKGTGLADIDLGALTPADGFVIEGDATADRTGRRVSAAGDVNGDGFDDLIVGAPYNDAGGTEAGAAYIIYGRGIVGRDDDISIDEDDMVTGNVFADNGAGTDLASNGLELAIVAIDGVAADVGTQLILASGALLTLAVDGSFNYDTNGAFDYLITTAEAASTGAVNDSFTDSFTYTLADGNTATVTITINGLDSFEDQLWGDSGNNVITGTPVNDTIDLSQGGNDSATGQSGDDEFRFGSNFTAADSIDGNGGPGDRLSLAGDYASSPLVLGATTLLNVEIITLATGFSYDITSNNSNVAAGSFLVVDDGALDAASSFDFHGGAETDGRFQLFGGAASDSLTGGSGNDELEGGSAADTLTGAAGDDDLDGNAGADTMIGGIGDDTYFVDHLLETIVEAAGSGTDLALSTVTYTLSASVENLTLTGLGAINGTGNGGANTITGNESANILSGAAAVDTLFGNGGTDTLDGGTGGDIMQGGAGDDSYIVESALDQVIELASIDGTDTVRSSISYTLGAHVEKLTLTGIAVLNGTGNSLDNVLLGNVAANQLDGGTGADEMRGGAGDDTYIVDQLGDLVFEISPADGIDTVRSSISFVLGSYMENLVLTGSGSVDATGNTLVNSLTGNSGNNVLNGGAGADTMTGLTGDDTYIVDDLADVVVEAAGSGTDLVSSGVDYTLSASIENLTLTGSAVIGAGNNAANVITGNNVANTLTGGAANDTLYGDFGTDTLDGGDLHDSLYGGPSSDDLTGGAGFDGFYFDAPLNAAVNVDDILDFVAADDTIYLDRDIFTGIGANGAIGASAFRLGTAALDADDRILYDSVTGQIRYDADGTGGTASILFATVTAGLVLTSADFVGYI